MYVTDSFMSLAGSWKASNCTYCKGWERWITATGLCSSSATPIVCCLCIAGSPFTNATTCRLVGGLTSEAERAEVLLYEVEQLILLGCEAGY